MGKGTEWNNDAIIRWRETNDQKERNRIEVEFLERNPLICTHYKMKFGDWVTAEIYMQLVLALQQYKIGSKMSFLGYFKEKLAWKLPYKNILENALIKPPSSCHKDACKSYKDVQFEVPDDLDAYIYGNCEGNDSDYEN